MFDEEKTDEVFQHGSIWLKADFHLHTRADKEFLYSGEENSFIKDYCNQLKEQSINIGVITNHNKFDKNEFFNLRKKARRDDIFLLPGVELSVNDGANGIHTLIVFSDEWIESGADYINQFLNVAFQGRVPIQYERENGRTSLNLIETIKNLDVYQRDYFLVFAHVEQNSGFWKELDGGRLAELAKNESFRKRTLGFQKVRTHDAKDKKSRTKVQSWFVDWYPGVLESKTPSDCKSIEEIGNKNGETWLKIGDFTFEAVKYALTDYKNRVRSTQPAAYKHSHVKSISFEGGTLNGQTVYFSPELNTLIGIRGSGKSSILEAVRYVLDIPFGEKATDEGYKKGLIAHTLGSGGKAVITAQDQYGSEFQIKRILNEYSEVYADGKRQPGVSIRETIIRSPIYFGQKDLSSSGEGFEKDLVEKLVGERLYNIRRQIEEKKQVVSDIVYRLKKLENIDDQIEEYTKKKQDAEFQLRRFKQYGIEEKFKKQTDFDVDERKLNQIIADIKAYRDDLKIFITQHEDTIKNHLSYTSSQNQRFFTDFMKEYANFVDIFQRHQSDAISINKILQSLKLKFTEFSETKRAFNEEFAEIRRKIEADLKEKGLTTLNLEEYPALKNQIDFAVKMLHALNKQKIQASKTKEELFQALSQLNNLWQQEFQLINNQLNKINEGTSALKIEAEFKADKSEFCDFMKNMFKGSGLRENTYQKLTNEYQDFGKIYEDFKNAKKKVGSFAESFEEYFLNNLKDLLIYQVPNQFIIKYRGKELQHHSLGQRASALILFVLNQQENDVIIVDQPEDDLDNQTIYEDVIKLIRELKPVKQFIFATHNANIPVLGDAEQIHSCSYSDDKISVKSGSIDCPILQKEIVDIMEGGEDAFNKRKEIYQIWKLQNL